MALVRVYCGLASADAATTPPGSEAWLTVAVVDDSGRLLDICDISNDAGGYAELGALLAERSSGPSIAVAADNDEHVVTRLLTAAGQYLAYTDDGSADDYAERFADDESAEEIQSSVAERRAIGLARALQAGVLSAVPQATPRDLVGLKPVLAAHTALLSGRQGAAATLREVLRELYPAALRAYPDPAEPTPLAILDALPEPGLLGTGARSRDAEVIAELTSAGVADAGVITDAVTALRVAISETPRRTGLGRAVTGAVAESVRQAVAAVRACDAAAAALVSVLAARMPGNGAVRPVGARTRPVPVPAAAPAPVDAPPLRAVREQPSIPEPAGPAMPRRGTPYPQQPAAAATGPMSNGFDAPTGGNPTVTPSIAAMFPTRGPAPVPAPVSPAIPPPMTAPAPVSAPAASVRQPEAPPAQRRSGPGELDRYAPTVPDYANSLSVPALSPDVTAPGSRANWPLSRNPLTEPTDDGLTSSGSYETYEQPLPPVDQPLPAVDLPRQREGRVTPPWQADDLPAEPPALRLVEPAPLTDPALTGTGGYAVLGELRYEPPSLRLIEPDPLDPPVYTERSRNDRPTALDRPMAPVSDDADGDLLIFAATSAWFTTDDPSSDLDWSNPSDAGWRAAEQAAAPLVAEETTSGLPKRVPQQNLVPGSPIAAPERPLRIVRNAAEIAAHTTGYFRGWRRGQEVGGYRVGGRPGREPTGGWDFSRDQTAERDYEYRQAGNGNR